MQAQATPYQVRRHRCVDEAQSAVGFTRAAWLVLVEAGDWLSPAQIVDRLPLEIGAREPSVTLWIMAKRHGLLVTRGSYADRQYAVTPECKVPLGVQFGEVLAAAKRRGGQA